MRFRKGLKLRGFEQQRVGVSEEKEGGRELTRQVSFGRESGRNLHPSSKPNPSHPVLIHFSSIYWRLAPLSWRERHSERFWGNVIEIWEYSSPSNLMVFHSE